MALLKNLQTSSWSTSWNIKQLQGHEYHNRIQLASSWWTAEDLVLYILEDKITTCKQWCWCECNNSADFGNVKANVSVTYDLRFSQWQNINTVDFWVINSCCLTYMYQHLWWFGDQLQGWHDRGWYASRTLVTIYQITTALQLTKSQYK